MRRRAVQAMLAAAICLMPAVTSAQDTLGTAYPGVLGQGRFLTVSGSSQQYLRYALTANRSYFAVCWSVFSIDQSTDCNVDWRDSGDLSVGTTNEIEPFASPFTGFAGDGDSYLPTAAGSFYVRIANSNVAASNTNVMVIESTLFSPWWYGLPSAGYDSWVQIRNSTAQTLSVTLRVYANTGVIAATSVQSVPANGVVLVQVGSLVPAGGAGSLSLAFAGPPGSIAANTTTLSGSTGLSFDAPFTPRMYWSSFGYLQ